MIEDESLASDILTICSAKPVDLWKDLEVRSANTSSCF